MIVLIMLVRCAGPVRELKDYRGEYTVDKGKPVSVMLTAYSTTLLANGTDRVNLHVTVTDILSRQITSASDSIFLYMDGEGALQDIRGNLLPMQTDSTGVAYVAGKLVDGRFDLVYVAGKVPGKTRIEARSRGLWAGGHEIHLLPSGFEKMVPLPSQLPETTRAIPGMIGADISFLPQLENERNLVFKENGQVVDAVRLLHDHGFNFIRLRLFVNPENEKGYSPAKGYCGLDSTLKMAHRVKEAGMNLLLNFHYSDYWADPQQQYKPMEWENLDFDSLADTLRSYTARVIRTFRQQGVMPDMVQIGNEINHGILWPDGHMGNPDQLANLLKAGVEGARSVDPDLPVMMHIALGGQNEEAVFWLDNMIARGVEFDVIGLSYYPRWHGTLDDLNRNMHDLVKRYHKPLIVVEYSNFKRQVHEIVFSLPRGMGTGTCIWEPLNQRSGLFDRELETTGLIRLYDTLNYDYL